ncbi:hypothetical protein J7K60_00695 [Candidatus Bipolaricaulota bacterium]|nr:hypothetical protein [Candidatus Bipolaricaulota bacterium]
MSKRGLLLGLLVVGVAMLSGCELLNQFTAIFTGGWTPAPGAVVSGRMKINLAATVWRDNGYTGAQTYAGSVAATFWSGAGTYSENSRLFIAYSWNGGDFSETQFTATLSEDGKTITSFDARQTQANAFLGHTYMHVIVGANVPYSHIEGNSRYYRIDGKAARALVTAVQYEAWVPSSMAPGDWITGGPAALTGDAGDYIEIRLDYENAAVAP